MKVHLLLIVIVFNLAAYHTIAQPSVTAKDVTIRRTEYGVPHILSSTLRGAAFGLAYCELEDYGEPVITRLLSAQGNMALIEGPDAIQSDMISQQVRTIVANRYDQLSSETRDLLEGFAEGIMFYIQNNSAEFLAYRQFNFNGIDVAAASTFVTQPLRGKRILDKMKIRKAQLDSLKADNESGSNTWAFGPEKTKSGHAILMRNPHLSWQAGYYEAHLTVPGKLNFYGDFRIGGLFGIVGGFNNRLGWSTTNNNPDIDEFYAFSVDPQQPDHYLLDGKSIPIQRKLVEVEFKNGEGTGLEKKEFLSTLHGPVVAREAGKVYVLKRAGHLEVRRAEQFTRMMLAQNIDEWKAAMRMQAITQSNYTYADADKNIFYVWNGTIPKLPVASGGDSVAIQVNNEHQIWSELIPFDELPKLQNPKGGYLHNENDPFHFTNLHEIMEPKDFPLYFAKPRLRQRSQHSLGLIHNTDKYSLEEVVELKHSMRMEIAYQLKDDLLLALKKFRPRKDVKKAMRLINSWDNSVHAHSKGGVLFAEWYALYQKKRNGKPIFKTPWQFEQPLSTPSGLANDKDAVDAFIQAVHETKEKFGAYDAAWGSVHRIRHGDMDLPASGCPGGLGCFRVLGFRNAPDGKRQVYRGDGWQFAVEFSNPPKAYSILAYGQSNDPTSAHHTDQLELFANNKMKRVAFTEAEIRSTLIRSYKPGE